MIGLLKADFRRVFKDKMLIVMGVLAVVFAVVTPLLYAIIFNQTDLLADEATAQMIANLITGKSQFFTAFSMGNNLGLIAPILLAIVLCKDFSFGTIRNKIIAGKRRPQIFLSLFITCAVVLTAVMMLHAFLTLGVSLIFFDYQATPFTTADFWYFAESLVFEILVLLAISAILSWLCVCMKNAGLAVVLYIAISFALTMAGSVLQMIVGFLETTDVNVQIISLLKFINRINIGNSAAYIGMGTEYALADVLYLTIPALIWIAGFIGAGLFMFNKKDLK